jgi:predicted DNA-binding transcriptional regulator YafY
MNRIDRLFALHAFLQSRKYVTAEAIAEKFGTSVRTVYRDIKALGESGVPVGYDTGRGYFLVPGHFLPPVAFSTEEASALLLMEGFTQMAADKSIGKLYSSALTKVRAVLRAAQKEEVETLAARTVVRWPECMVQDFEYLADLQRCIAGRKMIELQYQNKAGEESRRLVEPVGLVFYAMNWHILGWCHQREAYRDFRVSRILGMRCTEKPFSKAEHIEVSEYMKELPADIQMRTYASVNRLSQVQ